MIDTIRSAMGALLQTAQKRGKQFVIPDNTTLNQKYGVFPELAPDDVLQLRCNYLCIGIGGYKSERGTNGLYKTVPLPHQPFHAALYNMIPFIARPVANDLPAAERNKYRLRVVVNIGGVDYALYYLRVLEATTAVPTIELRTGNEFKSWTFPSDALTPVPPVLTNNQVMSTGDDTLVVSDLQPITFTANDTAEILDAVRLLFGDEGYATVGEMGICAGIDKVVPGNFNGASIPYTEVISCFITDFFSIKFEAPMLSEGVSYMLEAGAFDPLLVITSLEPN